MAINLAPYKGVFGLPPPAYVSSDMIDNSMPILEITPGEPNFSLGLTLFTINTLQGWTNYTQILGNHGFKIDRKPLKFAFVADNFPTDTFSNEYTETFLQKFTDVASGGLSQLIQMSGAKDFSGAVKEYGGILSQAGESMGGGLGNVLKTVAGTGVDMAGKLKAFAENSEGSNSATARTLGGGMNLVDKMLAGHRIDFPQIWSNSGYSPSYSVTIRLYNPNPGNKLSTLKYIAGPLCAILCLATPRSLNGASYRWPFYHKMRVRGLYELNPAVITNITVVKGGDQQQIAFNQMMSMCDVRIDFISLHKSMLLEEGNPAADNRPTVRRYIDELTNGRSIQTRARMNNTNNKNQNANASVQKERTLTDREIQRLRAQRAASIRLPAGAENVTTVNQRVSPEQEIAGELTIVQAPDGAYVLPPES